jgi:hypothetical protein
VEEPSEELVKRVERAVEDLGATVRTVGRTEVVCGGRF